MRPAVQPTYSDAWSRAGSAAGLASRSWSRTGEGARATIGAAAVAQAAPDGHTLIVSNSGSHGISPHIYPNPGYRPLDDFTHIALIALTPHALLVNPAHPGQPLRLPGGCAAGRGDALRGLRHRLLGASARRPPRRGDRPPGRAGAPPRRRPRGRRRSARASASCTSIPQHPASSRATRRSWSSRRTRTPSAWPARSGIPTCPATPSRRWARSST